MTMLQIEILNPRAKNLLAELSALELIRIAEPEAEGTELWQLVRQLRSCVKEVPSFAELTEVVEEIREQSYKKQCHD